MFLDVSDVIVTRDSPWNEKVNWSIEPLKRNRHVLRNRVRDIVRVSEGNTPRWIS